MAKAKKTDNKKEEKLIPIKKVVVKTPTVKKIIIEKPDILKKKTGVRILEK